MTTIPELRESLIAIPPNIISINLYSNPLHKITTDGLEVLKDTLPHVTKLCLSADELQKMSLKQIRAFKNIFPNLRIEDLIFIDENDKTRRPNLKELKQLGFVPSLKLISAFFVLENQLSKNIKADELPIELVRYIDSLKQ
jgi:hypothetical protein